MKPSIAALFVLIGAAVASENIVENGLRGSDSATRKLPKNGKGKDDAGPKTQEWSCEAVNASVDDITHPGDAVFTCNVNGGRKFFQGKPGSVGDTCQPCCLCGENPIVGVCSTLRPEGATEDKACPAGIPLLGSGYDTCDEACAP